MKSEHLSIGLLALITSCSLAQDIVFTNKTATFTNLEGRVYTNVTLVKATEGGIVWKGDGLGMVPYTKLSPEVLKSLGIPVERIEQVRVRAGQKAAADAEYRAAQVDVPTREPTAAPVVNFWQSYVTNYKIDLSTLDSDALAHMPNEAADAMRQQLQQELELDEIRNKGLLDVEANLHKEGLISEQQFANARLAIERAVADKKRKLAEDEMQGELDAKKAYLLELKKRQPALAANMFNAVKIYLDVKERENHGDSRALVLPRATTATNKVAGAFGFVLGEKFTNDNALAYSTFPAAAGWTHNKDGGYSYFSNTNKPFDSVSAWADEGGRICLLCGSARSDSPSELFNSTKGVLAGRYPERYAETSKVIFGSSTRCVLLVQGESSVVVFYEDDELWHVFQERIKKAKEATIRGALGEKP